MTREPTVHARRSPTTLAGALDRSARHAPDALAVVEGTTSLTFADLHHRVGRLADHLAGLGVADGDVVTAQLPSWWEMQVLAHATSLLGAVLNPVVSIYRRSEVAFIVEQARPRLLVVPREHRGHDYAATAAEITAALDDPPLVLTVRDPEAVALPGLEPPDGTPSEVDPSTTGDVAGRWSAAADRDVHRPAFLLYTSGSTARPKGAVHSSHTLLHEARQVADLARLSRDDRMFMPSPVTHVTGLAFGVVLPADVGIGVVMQDRWDAEVAVDLVEEHGCTFTVSATTFLQGMTATYEARGTRSSLEVFICGGAEIGPALVGHAHAVTGARVVRCYGSTELPTFCIGDPWGDLALEARHDGRPVAGAQAWVDTDEGWARTGRGELLVRGDELFLGYLDPALDDDSFALDARGRRFFRTGDVVDVAEDGACTVVGRIKDIIIRGGENLSVIEVEDHLQRHPAVRDVAVVAMPDEQLGEKACAYVVPDGAPPTLAALCEHLREQGLARQKCPERLEVVDTLPRTASGKVQKFVLREQIARRLEDEGGAAGRG